MVDQLVYPSSTLQRYRHDINMLSPYKIQANNTTNRTKKASNTKLDNNSHHELHLKRPKMISNDLAKPDTKTEATNKRTSNQRNENKLKCCPFKRIKRMLTLTMNI